MNRLVVIAYSGARGSLRNRDLLNDRRTLGIDAIQRCPIGVQGALFHPQAASLLNYPFRAHSGSCFGAVDGGLGSVFLGW